MKTGALSRHEIWSELRANLDDELLARLLLTPSSHLDGYAREAASPVVEARARYLVNVLQHLSGTYNRWGIHRWFERSRAQLDGKSPLQALVDAGEWTPDSQAAADVATLAWALVGMPAT